MHFVASGIGSIVVFFLRVIQSTQWIGDVLVYVLKVFPSFCLTNTIIFDANENSIFYLRPELKRASNFDISLVGGDVLALCLHFVVWSVLLVLIEAGAFNWIKNI